MSPGNKAFMLLEVLLSLLIISSGIVFIIQSYSTSLRAAQVTSALTKACFILEDKLFVQDIKGFRDGIKEGDESDAVEGEKYYWFDFSAHPLDETQAKKINRVDLSVSYSKGSLKRKVGITTLLKYSKT